MIRQVNALATGGLAPDLTILLDVSPEVGLARVAGREAAARQPQLGEIAGVDQIEQRRLKYHQRVRAGYLALAEADPERIKVVPTTAVTPAAVASQVRTILAQARPDLFAGLVTVTE
jgi:dTMP kinase